MSSPFTAEDIALASQMVKRATPVTGQPLDRAISSGLGYQGYHNWYAPAPTIRTPPAPRAPGFWGSLGQTAVGHLDRGPIQNVRSFFGVGTPGHGGLRNMTRAGWDWTAGHLFGNQAQLDQSRKWFSSGVTRPALQAQQQAEHNRGALGRYWKQIVQPNLRPGGSMLTRPGNY